MSSEKRKQRPAAALPHREPRPQQTNPARSVAGGHGVGWDWQDGTGIVGGTRPLLGQDERPGAAPMSTKETYRHFYQGTELMSQGCGHGALLTDPQCSETVRTPVPRRLRLHLRGQTKENVRQKTTCHMLHNDVSEMPTEPKMPVPSNAPWQHCSKTCAW